jgi:uncharacterized protein YjbI with pentapeptide repeats
MANIEKRVLIDVAIKVCTGLAPDTEYGLITTNSVQLAQLGVWEVAKSAISFGKIYRTAGELAENYAGLQTLILARLTDSEKPTDLWIFDGWSLLRSCGEDIDLRGALLRGAQLRGARMKGADLENADLCGADMEKADLSTANLTGAGMAGINLFSANLQAANLTEAELCRANLRHADLREAICVRTAFCGADLWNAYMWNVDVSQAFTTGADFKRADYLSNVISRAARKNDTRRQPETK